MRRLSGLQTHTLPENSYTWLAIEPIGTIKSPPIRRQEFLSKSRVQLDRGCPVVPLRDTLYVDPVEYHLLILTRKIFFIVNDPKNPELRGSLVDFPCSEVHPSSEMSMLTIENFTVIHSC